MSPQPSDTGRSYPAAMAPGRPTQQDDFWRDKGREHYDVAARQAGENPTLNALLAIYCELRQSSNGSAAQAKAMEHLAGSIRLILP